MTILFLVLHDSEIIQMLSKKIGKKISETLFYRLKKEATKKRGDSEAWLDYFARYQYVEYYRKRIEELEYVQRKLLEALIDETEKPKDEKKDKTIINQLSKQEGGWMYTAWKANLKKGNEKNE